MERQAGVAAGEYTMRVQGLGNAAGYSQVNRRSVPAPNRCSQELLYIRPATHRQYGKTIQAPGSPNTQRAALREALRPKSERALSPQVPGSHPSVPEVRSFSRQDQGESDRRQGYLSPQTTSYRLLHSGGQLSPFTGSPSGSPQVPVNFAMVSPPPPTSLQPQLYHGKPAGRRYVPQDFGTQPHSYQLQHHFQGETTEPSMPSAPRSPYTSHAASTRALPGSSSTSSLHACLQQNFLEDSRVRERSSDTEDPFYKLRQEIQTQCKLHAEMIRAEVSSLCSETGRRLHEEISKLQDAKDEEFTRAQAVMRNLDAKVRECEQKLDTGWQESAKASSCTADELQVFQNELEAERICRSDQIKEVHDRIFEEVARMTKLIEESRTASLEAIALEHSARSSDTQELRATIESLWSQVPVAEACSKPVKEEPLRAEEPSGAGDPEDIYTLYEMAREALGDTVHLRQLVTEERSERIREISSNRQQMDMLSRELNTVQNLLREASAGGNKMGFMSATDDSLEGS